MFKLGPRMSSKKSSSRLHTIVKVVLVAAILPVAFIYIIVARPNYRIITNIAHFSMPIVNAFGDLVTWPIRASGNIAMKIHNISNLEQENEELRVRLAQALEKQNEHDIAIREIQRLQNELDVVRSSVFSTIVADVTYDNTALNHGTFIINRGTRDGVEPGMVVVSFENKLAGIVIDAGANFARVRSIIDSNTNIAVRVAGSDVYGFLRGNGSSTPTFGFISDSKFQPGPGVKLLTSSISGVLPPNIYVGDLINDSDVDVLTPRQISRVMVLKFNSMGQMYE